MPNMKRQIPTNLSAHLRSISTVGWPQIPNLLLVQAVCLDIWATFCLRTADPEEWYQPNPATPVTQAPQGISPQMLGAVDPMYYQQYQYQNVPQIPQVQPQQGFSPQYQYPYYQQGQYAQYAAGAQPCGAQQLYQHQQAANRPPSQQAGGVRGNPPLGSSSGWWFGTSILFSH